MKKLKLFILIVLCSILFFSPTVFASAESSTEVFYPSGIEDYVDLNDITHIAVNGNQIFYSQDKSTIICYNKDTKISTTLTKPNNQGNINNIEVAGDYLFLFSASGKTFAYNLSDLSSASFASSPTGFNTITVNYNNGNYYFSYIAVQSGYNRLIVTSYSTLSDSGNSKSCNYNFPSTILGSSISMSSNLIAIKPEYGNEIYLIKDYTTDELNLLTSSSGTYYEITGFDDNTETLDIAIIEYPGESYNNRIYITYSSSTKTLICNFNGTKLTYEDDNSVISSKFSVYNNQLYVYNEETSDVALCEYDTTSGVFSETSVVLAGKGSEPGRFKDVSNINFVGDTYYITDSGNDRIQIINDTIFASDEITGTISEIVTDSKGNYYYTVASGSNTKLYSNNNIIQTIYGDKIISIAMNLDDTLYLVSSSKIYTYKNLDYTSQTLSITLKNNSRLRIVNDYTNNLTPIDGVVAESNYLISVNDTIYSVNPTTGATNLKFTFDSYVADFKANDAVSNNPIYVLLSNGNFIKTSLTATQDNDITLNGFDEYSTFAIDVISGKFAMYNTNLSAIEIYLNESFSPTNNLTHYNTTAYNSNGFNQLWKYAQVKSKSLIYDYYNYLGKCIELQEVTKAIVLEVPVDEQTQELGKFAYIAYNQDDQLKFGYVSTSDLVDGIKSFETDGSTYKLRTTNKNVAVYKYPSIFNNFNFYTFQRGYIFDTYGKYISPLDNYEYYIVKIGSEYGYICANDVVLSDNTTRNIRTNASVKIYDGKESINVYISDSENSSIIYKLTDGYKINVEDYNKNKQFTKITFIDDDQQEREGYILTSYVKLAGLSTTVLTAIILLVLDIIIAIIVIAFYRHYKKKQKENSDIIE